MIEMMFCSRNLAFIKKKKKNQKNICIVREEFFLSIKKDFHRMENDVSNNHHLIDLLYLFQEE